VPTRFARAWENATPWAVSSPLPGSIRRVAGRFRERLLVAPAAVSPEAQRKAAIKLTETGEPATSFRSMRRHLACLTTQHRPSRPRSHHDPALVANPAAAAHVFDLLAIKLLTWAARHHCAPAKSITYRQNPAKFGLERVD
jgi:hypothetical protein